MNVELINASPKPEELVCTAARNAVSVAPSLKICPTCGRSDFKSERGVKLHHSRSHGVSLSKVDKVCPGCGGVHRAYRDRRDYCSRGCRNNHQKVILVGSGNPNWKPLVALRCELCDDVFEVPAKRQSEARFCSPGCSNEWKSEAWVGENHHNWRGGKSPYYGRNWHRVRRRVIERDGGCVSCGSVSSRLEVHHIEPLGSFDTPEEANTMGNLVLLCSSCHHNVEHGNIDCPKPGVAHAS